MIFVILEFDRPNPNFFAHSVSYSITHAHSVFCHSPDRVTDVNINQPSICPSAALSVSLILVLICFFVLNFSLFQTGPEYGQGMNPISRLAQIQQAKKEKEPEYMLLSERGMPRRREFIMQVNLVREGIRRCKVKEKG